MVCKYFYAENADRFPGLTAQSMAVHEYDKFIHRICYPSLIHPHSLFRIYWESAMVIFALLQYVFVFFVWGFARHDKVSYQTIVAFMLLVHFVDIVLMFFTGYVEKGSEIVVLDRKRIAWRYLIGTFISDVLACVPAELLTYIKAPQCVAAAPAALNQPCQFIMCFTVISVYLRVFTSVRYLSHVYQVMFWNPFLLSLISVISYFFFIVSLHMIFTFLVDYSLSIRQLYFDNYWQAFETIVDFLLELIFKFVYHRGYSGWLYFLRVLASIATTFFSVYLMAYFIKFTKFTMRTKERFYVLETNVRIFARKRRLPLSLKKKTFLYFKVLIQSNVYKQDEMFNYFPEAFKSDLLTHYSLPVIKRFYYFEDLPLHVMRRLMERLKYQLCLPNEIVMMKDEVNLSLFFIQNGTVALYSGDNTELYHFEDGSTFNGANFIEGKIPRDQYAISIEVTELFRLDYTDFLDIMSSYPRLLEKIKEKFSQT